MAWWAGQTAVPEMRSTSRSLAHPLQKASSLEEVLCQSWFRASTGVPGGSCWETMKTLSLSEGSQREGEQTKTRQLVKHILAKAYRGSYRLYWRAHFCVSYQDLTRWRKGRSHSGAQLMDQRIWAAWVIASSLCPLISFSLKYTSSMKYKTLFAILPCSGKHTDIYIRNPSYWHLRILQEFRARLELGKVVPVIAKGQINFPRPQAPWNDPNSAYLAICA